MKTIKEKTISIYCTADLHSNIPTSVNLLEELIRKKGEKTLLIDLGDFSEGSPFYNLFSGLPENKIINKIYNIIIPGNHDFEDILNINKTKSDVKIINANIYKSGKLVFKPNIIINKLGYKFGFISIISPGAFNAIEIDKRKNFTAIDPCKILRKEILKLKDRVDFLFLLSHSGMEYDKILAEKFKEFDAIFSSHCHSRYKQKFVNKTLIVKPPENGKGLIELLISDKNKIKYNIKTTPNGNELFKMPELLFLNSYLKKYYKTLNKKLFSINKSFCLKFTNRKLLADYIIHKLQKFYQADIYLINYSCLRDIFRPGRFTLEKLYRIMPFDNYLVTFKIDYSNYKKIICGLDDEIKKFFCINKYNSKLLKNEEIKILTTSYLFHNIFNRDSNLKCKKEILLRDFIGEKIIK